MTPRDEPSRSLKITALGVPDAARAMASAYGRRVTEDQVRQIAEAGGLLAPDDTLNLLDYVAYLIQEGGHGPGTD